MRKPMNVLVTGSSGRIGRAVVAELVARGHRVRGLDLVATPGLADCVVAPLGDLSALRNALAGMEVLIHLAATPDDADFVGELVPNNLIAVHQLLECAVAAGVRRWILASTGQVNDVQQWRGPWPIRASDPVSPRWWYAATKLFLESMGFSYAHRHGVQVIAVRLGWCPRTPAQVREIAAEERFRDVYLSPGDAGRFFACAVENGGGVPFEILYAVSRAPVTPRFELEPARRSIGYEPVEQWPQGLEVVLGHPPRPEDF